jgi:hypothetical protein
VAKFQNVAGLAVEHGTYAFERVETNASHLAGLEQRHVLLGDADARATSTSGQWRAISWMRSRRAGDGETELGPALTPRHT